VTGRLDELGELDDVSLLHAHADGDPDAFGILFTRHRDRLWAVAVRTTGNPEDAADALQEAMISAFRRAHDFRAEALVTTWLHRIVVNASLDRLRRNKVRAASALPDDLEEHAGRGAVLTSTSDRQDPALEAVRSEQRSQVLQALDRLPADQKAALVLVDMEGYPVEEAARILGCPTGTVKSRCARGRHRLVALLAETGITGGEAPERQGPAGTARQPVTSDSGTAGEGGAR
jgi:RNA polymerase sigma-70 factor (ECF subfamily)